MAIGGTDLSLAQIKALQANGTKELLLALDMDEPGQDRDREGHPEPQALQAPGLCRLSASRLQGSG